MRVPLPSRSLSTAVRALIALLLVAGIAAAALPGTTRQASAAASLHYLYGSGSQTGGKRITLRVELTEPAPSGGAVVTLSSSSSSVQTPATIRVNTGQTEREFTVATTGVAADTDVTVSATYAGVTRSRVVLIKAPILTSIGVQSKIRAGGVGKVIIRLSGDAPAGGFAVTLTSDPSGALTFPVPAIVPEGTHRLALTVPAIHTIDDLATTVTANAGSVTLSKDTIIRNYDPVPTATATATNTATATETATSTATATATQHPNPLEVTFESWNGTGPFPTTGVNNWARFRVCFFLPVGMEATANYTATNGGTVNPPSVTLPVVSGPTYWCDFADVSMTEAGETSLVVTVVVDGLPDKVFTSDPVTFFVPATATPTNTNTPEPTATSTNTPEPTATNTEVPTATATATLPALSGEMTITLINGPGPFTEGNPATFNICFFGVGAKTYTLDVAATNGEVSPVSSTIMTGGIGYGCAPTSFNLLGNVGDASITATLTLAGSAPFVQTSETITTIDSDGR